jgi:spore germination protein
VFTYGFREDGTLIEPEDTQLIETAKSYGVSPLLLLSTLTDEGVFNNNLSSRLFADPLMQEKLIENLIDTALSKGYEGIEIDFEFIPKEDSSGYVNFLTKLKAELIEEGLPLFVALAPKTSDDQPGLLYEGHDYKAIGQISDYVILMTYEWGYQFGPPLAVAPIRNVEQVVKYAVSVIDNDKILLGVPNYAYDWRLPYIKGETEANGISNSDALNTALENGAEIKFDNDAKTPYFYYYKDGNEHVVWFENARSIDAKLDLVDKYDLAGISIWQVMRFFPQLYGVLKSKFDNVRN